MIYASDAPELRAVLHVVGRRVDISMQDEWGDCTPRTQFGSIGAADGMDDRMLDEMFTAGIARR